MASPSILRTRLGLFIIYTKGQHAREEGPRPLDSSRPSHVRHSKQASLLAFYSSPGHSQRRSPSFHLASNRPRKTYGSSSRMESSQWERGKLERKIRAVIAKETLESLPDVLNQLPLNPPTGYLHTPPKTRLLDPKYCPRLKGEVRVVNGDTFDTAIQFDQLFPRKDSNNIRPVCVLNMANAYTAGGGWLNGAIAQEEELCYRSSLSLTLKKWFYPLGPRDGIYSPNVVIIRGRTSQGCRWLDLTKPESLPVVSAVSMAALERPEVLPGKSHLEYKRPADRELMREKMRVILRVAAYNEHRRLVMGAFGCGVFENPREEVAKCWVEVLKEKEFQGWWETVAFAIMTPGQSQQRPSLEVFKEVLDGLSI